jgi:hypothetical protein
MASTFVEAWSVDGVETPMIFFLNIVPPNGEVF